MENYLQNVFDDFSLEETEHILNEIENMPYPKERGNLVSRILEECRIQMTGTTVEFTPAENKKTIKKTLCQIRNIAACFFAVLLLSSISIYAFSGKSLFDFFLQQNGDEIISGYAQYNGDTMIIDDYIIKLDSYLLDEKIGSGYCLITVERKDKISDDLKKFLNYNYIHFVLNTSGALAELERTIQDNVVYIPILLTQDAVEDIRLQVIGDFDYIEEKEASISKEPAENIIYDENGSIFEIELGSLSLKNTKKLPNKNRTFQTNAKLFISSIGLMTEGLNNGRIFDLSIEYVNGEKEILIENYELLSKDMMLTTSDNLFDINADNEPFRKSQLLYGKVIELDNISGVNINGEQIDLN